MKISLDSLNAMGRSEVAIWVATIGNIASIVALCIQLATGMAWLTRVTVGILPFAVMACIWVIVHQQKLIEEGEARARLARYASIFSDLHAIFHRLRDALVDLRKTPPPPGNAYDEGLCRYMLDVFVRIFQRTTGHDCAACIKGIAMDKDLVGVIRRDSFNETHRGAGDDTRPCRVSGNSDFKGIVDGHLTCFCSNDLYKAAEEGKYFNDNPDWRKRYRSTIVWPIRCYDREKAHHELLGFLCIDSMEPNIFDEGIDVELGACVADMIYTYFSGVDAVNLTETPS